MKPFMSFRIVAEMICDPAGACDGVDGWIDVMDESNRWMDNAMDEWIDTENDVNVRAIQ